MIDSLGGPIVARLSKVGADPGDPTDLRLRKTLLVSVALMVLPASILWGLLFWAAGEPAPALCAWAYTVGSFTSLVAFRSTHSYESLRWAQLMLVLWAPFLFGVAAGGLVPSSGVVLWSFLAPLGAIAFDDPRRAWPWFGGFLVMVAATTPLAQIIRPDAAQLPEILVVVFLGLNIAAVSLIAFVLLAASSRRPDHLRPPVTTASWTASSHSTGSPRMALASR